MAVGSEHGTQPTRLTEGSAADAILGLLSVEEEKDSPETPAEETPKTEVEEGSEAPDESPEQDEPVEESESDEENEEQQPPTPRKHKVKIDGQELEVDEEELLKGYSRTQDYTRKTQAVAEERKAVLAKQKEILEQGTRYVEGLTQLETALKEAVPQEPNWEALAQDPAAYMETRKAWDQYQNQLAAVKAEREKAYEKVAAAHAEQFQSYLDEQKAALVEKLPEWSDAKVAQKETSELREFAESIGFSKPEIDKVYDHRLLLLLRKAMLFDRAEKAKPSVREKIDRVKTVTPGPKPSATPKRVAEVTKAKQRLAKTGSVSDAATAVELMLDD